MTEEVIALSSRVAAAEVVLARLNDAGIRVTPRDGTLWLNPRSGVTPDLADAVLAVKPELLALLISSDDAHAQNAIAAMLRRIRACHRPAGAVGGGLLAKYEEAVNVAARSMDRAAFDAALQRFEAHVVAYESGIQLVDEVAS